MSQKDGNIRFRIDNAGLANRIQTLVQQGIKGCELSFGDQKRF